MKLTAEVLVGPGRGYVFRLHGAPPPGFPEEVHSEQGVDYTLSLTPQEGSVELVSGEDWELVENRNVVLTVVKA